MSKPKSVIERRDAIDRRALANVRRLRRDALDGLTNKSRAVRFFEALTASEDEVAKLEEFSARIKSGIGEPLIRMTEMRSDGPKQVKAGIIAGGLVVSKFNFEPDRLGLGKGELTLAVPVHQVLSSGGILPKIFPYGKWYDSIDVVHTTYDETENPGINPDMDFINGVGGNVLVGRDEIYESEYFQSLKFMRKLMEAVESTRPVEAETPGN